MLRVLLLSTPVDVDLRLFCCSEVRVGGMLSGKAGLLYCHMVGSHHVVVLQGRPLHLPCQAVRCFRQVATLEVKFDLPSKRKHFTVLGAVRNTCNLPTWGPTLTGSRVYGSFTKDRVFILLIAIHSHVMYERPLGFATLSMRLSGLWSCFDDDDVCRLQVVDLGRVLSGESHRMIICILLSLLEVQFRLQCAFTFLVVTAG